MNIVKYLKGKLARLIFVFALIIVGFILLFFSELLYNSLFHKRIHIKQIENEISAAVNKMETLIEFAQYAPHELATILEIHNITKTESQILLKSALFNNAEFSGISICYEPYKMNPDSLHFSSFLYRNGDSLVFTTYNKEEDNYFYKDWYLVPKTLMEPTWSEPYYNEFNNRTLNSTYSVPFSYFDGFKNEFKGIVSLSLNVKALIYFAKQFGEKMNGSVLLISENGTILSASNQDWIFNETIFSLASEMNAPALRKIGRDLQRGIGGRETIKEFNNEANTIVFYSPVNINKWGFLLFFPQAEL